MSKKDRKGSKVEIIVAVSAILISISAVVVSVYEASIMRKQQQAMVWPNLSIGLQSTSNALVIDVTNDGMGPAIVTNVSIESEGEKFTNVASFLKTKIVEKYPTLLKLIEYGSLMNQTFSPQEELEVIRVNLDTLDAGNNEEWNELQTLLKNLEIEVKFKSIFGEEWLTSGFFSQPRRI